MQVWTSEKIYITIYIIQPIEKFTQMNLLIFFKEKKEKKRR